MATTYTGTLTVRIPKALNVNNIPKGEYEVKITAYDGGEIGWEVTKCPDNVPHISVVGTLIRSNSTHWKPSLPKDVKNRYLRKNVK